MTRIPSSVIVIIAVLAAVLAQWAGQSNGDRIAALPAKRPVDCTPQMQLG
jgi:hypothetical protein